MKEMIPEDKVEYFLRRAHDALNRDAANGKLCEDGNEARLLIGQALTLARRHPGKSMLGRWPAEQIAKIEEARKLLMVASCPEADRALSYCDDAVTLISQARNLKRKFEPEAKDIEAPLRFFGNAKVANQGRGHGVPLDRPLMPAEAVAGRKVDAAVGDDDADGGPRHSWRRGRGRGLRR